MRKDWIYKTGLLVLLAAIVLSVVISLATADDVDQLKSKKTFFDQFIIAGGPIVWFVLIPMSVITAFLAVEMGLAIRTRRLVPSDIEKTITDDLQNADLPDLRLSIEHKTDLVSNALKKAIDRSAGDMFRLRSIITESLQEQATSLIRRIEWLNLMGNVSPMVGLFGTVFGMIKLFNSIVLQGGQPQPANLADGISVALVTTFWGLFIAIPALAVHGIYRNRIETLVNQAVEMAEIALPQLKKAMNKPVANNSITSEDTNSKPRKIPARHIETKDIDSGTTLQKNQRAYEKKSK
jgi:biopolymer transport protein ExbB